MAWSSRGVPNGSEVAPDRYRRPVWLWLVPILSLLLTIIAWHVTRVSTAARASDRFKFRTSMIETVIEQRLQSHINVLRGVVGLFDAAGNVPAAEWERYLQAVHPETSAPGLQGVGFSARVPRAERSAFERRIQEQRWPLAIWPNEDRDEFHAVVHVHPITPENLRALGYDMFTEPMRREAMTRARDQGAPALSSQVRLVQEGSQTLAQPGFLLFLPVYAQDQSTDSPAERRAALRGFVSGAFRARDLMDSIFGGQHWDVDFEIYDGAVPSATGLLYRSAPDGPPVADTEDTDILSQRLSLDIAGHRWLLIARPGATFMSLADRYQHWLIAGGGLAINLLLAAGLWAAATVRKRAVIMAEGMSQAVRVSEAQTQLMVDSITDHAIIRLDPEFNVASWNASAERMLGYSESEAISRPASRFWVGGDANPYVGESGIVSRQVREGWHSRKDGHRFWGAAAIAPLQQSSGKSSGYVVILRDDSSRRQAIEALAATSAELEQRTIELGRFNRLASGRELRMIELKRMVNERSMRLGVEAPFDLSFADEFADVPRPGEPF
jgi:PAS domain S-box-containing protein